MGDFLLTTNKEDNDPILDYTNIETSHLKTKQFYLQSVPILPATQRELVAYSLHGLEKMRKSEIKNNVGPQFVFSVDPFRLVWLKWHRAYHPLVKNAFLVLPEGAGMAFLAKSEGFQIPERVSLISYTMNLIRLAEAKGYTVFLVGSRDEVLEKLVVNLKRSYPKLRIVGKYHGYWKKQGQVRIVEALRKTDPHIVLLGIGYHKGLKFILENKDKLGTCLFINLGGNMDVLSGLRKKAPDAWALKGYTWLWRSLNNPIRWYRMIWVMFLFLRSFYFRIFKKSN